MCLCVASHLACIWICNQSGCIFMQGFSSVLTVSLEKGIALTLILWNTVVVWIFLFLKYHPEFQVEKIIDLKCKICLNYKIEISVRFTIYTYGWTSNNIAKEPIVLKESGTVLTIKFKPWTTRHAPAKRLTFLNWCVVRYNIKYSFMWKVAFSNGYILAISISS